MADVIEKYRLSDVDWVLTYRDSNGDPVDLTGWTVSIGWQSAYVAFQPDVVFIDASLGQMRFTVPWDDALPINTVLEARVLLQRGEEDEGTEPVRVKYV